MAEYNFPNSKVHGDNVGPTWGQQDTGGPYAGHMNFAIWFIIVCACPMKIHVQLRLQL